MSVCFVCLYLFFSLTLKFKTTSKSKLVAAAWWVITVDNVTSPLTPVCFTVAVEMIMSTPIITFPS